MTDTERRVYAVGHYSQLIAFWIVLGFFIWIGVMNELHPATLLPPCGAVK